MSNRKEVIMNWIFNKMVIVYAFAAAIGVGVIWLVGEIRLHFKLHPRKHKIRRKHRAKIIKLDADIVKKLQDDIS